MIWLLIIYKLSFILIFQGVIRDEEDLDKLGNEFKSEYQRKQVDPFDDNAWSGSR